MKIGNLVLITLVGLVMITSVKSVEAKIYGEQQAVLKKLPCDGWEKIKDLIIQHSEESINSEAERILAEKDKLTEAVEELTDEFDGIDMEDDEAVSAPEELIEKLSEHDAFVEALYEMVFQKNDEDDCDE
jgi:hypothetical protein